MDQNKFFQYWHTHFNTQDYKSTKAAWDKLSSDEKKQLAAQRHSAAMKKFYSDHPESKESKSAKLKNIKRPPDVVEKIATGLKSFYNDPNQRSAASQRQKDLQSKNPHTEKSRQQQSESLKQHYKDHPEAKDQIRESCKQYSALHHDELRQKTIDAMSAFYATPKGQENLKKWTNGSRRKGTSNAEKEIQDYVKSIYGGTILNNDRKLLNGKELDVYCPEKNIAIEHDGLIWHSEVYKPYDAKTSHLLKTEMCEKLGIRLIHIFSDEWQNQKEICKSLIASSLGVYDTKYFARKLTFKQIPVKCANAFLAATHIQGSAKANTAYGLYDKSELIQVITLGKNRFTKVKNIELIRMATKLHCQVLGGFSKLIKNAMKAENLTFIESYVDRRLFNASGYKSSGWKVIGTSGPRYFYTDGTSRFNRQQFMKQSCLKRWPESDPSMTEHEICYQHDLYQIYDCGTIKMEFNSTN